MSRDLLIEPNRKPPAPGRLVVTGVVGACVLGVGLGFWARPAAPGQAGKPPAPRAASHPGPARPALQIVLEAAPAPMGSQLEVLPADVRAAEPAPPTPLVVEPMAPRPAASGLMKVDAVVLAEPAPAPAIHTPQKPRAEPPQALELVIAEPPRPEPQPAKPKAAKARVAETRIAETKAAADRATEARARRTAELELEQAKTARIAKAEKLAKAEQLEQAKAARRAKAEELAKAEKLQQARLEKARFEKARFEQAGLEKVRLEKVRLDKAKAAKLAQAEARRERFAKADRAARIEKAARVEKVKAEARSKRLALLKTAKAEPRPVVRPKAVKVAAVKPARKPPAPAPLRKLAPKPPVLRGSGPMRVARANPCASPDPGEAAVCADQRLGARDRQLQQAYRNAEAAGVPASALRLQQARWLQARAAAAREAPWAVEDVYVARISELRDQTRDAREN